MQCITNSDSLNSRKETCKSSDSKTDRKYENQNQFDYYNIPENEDSMSEEDGESVSVGSADLRELNYDQINPKESFGSSDISQTKKKDTDVTIIEMSDNKKIETEGEKVNQNGEESKFNNYSIPRRTSNLINRRIDLMKANSNSD